MGNSVRPSTPDDLPLIASFIRELAEYEKLSHEVRFDEAEIGRNLFAARPYAEALIGEIDGDAQGFALFFHTFSTFEGKPGIWLEDLYVRPAARGCGLGKALLLHVGRMALERGCARFEARPQLSFLSKERKAYERCTCSRFLRSLLAMTRCT